MQNINYRYARWINKKEERIGHLFQGRYRSLRVYDDIYLINLCRYIHFNPVEANMVNSPDEYPWSSHQYCSKNNCPIWNDKPDKYFSVETIRKVENKLTKQFNG